MEKWHIWAGKNNKMSCMAHAARSWVVLDVGDDENKNVHISIHCQDGEDGKDALAKMYTALLHHLQASGILPALPEPIPPQEPEIQETENEIVHVDILLPKTDSEKPESGQ